MMNVEKEHRCEGHGFSGTMKYIEINESSPLA